MVNSEFAIWLSVIVLIAAIGLGSMIWAYGSSGSAKTLFTDLIQPNPLPTLNPQAASYFQAGCVAFQAGKLRRAIERWGKAIQRDPNFAEAFHNRAFAQANLGQNGDAARELVKAGELYLQQNNLDGHNRVKQDLETLRKSSVAESVGQ